MNIVVCYKSALEETSMLVSSSGVDATRARHKISDYDRNAIAAGMGVATETDRVLALTFGGLEAKKTAKDVLSRGPDQVYAVIANDAASADGAATAKVLAAAIRSIGDVDLVVCGEGSSDSYAHQVGPRIAALLSMPVMSELSEFSVEGTAIKGKRTVGGVTEFLCADLPAVATVLPAAAEAPIPGLKAVLAAGKKPLTEMTLAELGLDATSLAPKTSAGPLTAVLASRKRILFPDGDASSQVAGLVGALVKEGVLR
ncbi:MAG: electron transfer flavoprotein beta subunit/FixA family protein [Actinobacteria bacterium]|nr:electron transfer flavoprotein beta subunit/FixA family protein [Actinomycetota bacterium]MCG2802419.1 hypothetical protein [Cellulomonas sp.]